MSGTKVNTRLIALMSIALLLTLDSTNVCNTKIDGRTVTVVSVLVKIMSLGQMSVTRKAGAMIFVVLMPMEQCHYTQNNNI